jgi:hypothetical protein
LKNNLNDDTIDIRAVGDISFVGKNAEQPNAEVFRNVSTILKAGDLVIGNLEGPLTRETSGLEGKCNLRGHPGWAQYLKEAGFTFLSLANNHMMDFGEQGLFDSIESLKKNDITFAGAGRNITEANAPVFLEIKGKRVAIIARSSVIVSSPVNATPTKAGVAFLDEQETIDTIRKCRREADLVILILHWGLEEYEYPSPSQRMLAHNFISTGVDIILGHHPHVLEGMEYFNGGLCVYSLGNFIFDDFNWNYRNPAGEEKEMKVKLLPGNRKGLILNLSCKKHRIHSVEKFFTEFGPDGFMEMKNEKSRLKHFEVLSRRLKFPFYTNIWKFYSSKMEWNLRLKKRFGIRNVIKKFLKFRPHHIKELLRSLKKTSAIASEKTTNPYE